MVLQWLPHSSPPHSRKANHPSSHKISSVPLPMPRGRVQQRRPHSRTGAYPDSTRRPILEETMCLRFQYFPTAKWPPVWVLSVSGSYLSNKDTCWSSAVNGSRTHQAGFLPPPCFSTNIPLKASQGYHGGLCAVDLDPCL